MAKPLTPRLHSLIDYGLLGGNLLLPRLLTRTRRLRTVFASFALIQGGLTAITAQPFAVRKLVPFRLHGLIEKCSTPVYVLVPLLAGVWREPKVRAYWIALFAALVAVYNLTDWDAKSTSR
jgi:hypothetical protein